MVKFKSVPEPSIEVIPIQDLEPELLEELGLNPLPEDFLEKAKRDPSPLPEIRPQSRMASPPDILETLEEMGLQDVVEDIERQKEEVFCPPVEDVIPTSTEAAPANEAPAAEEITATQHVVDEHPLTQGNLYLRTDRS